MFLQLQKGLELHGVVQAGGDFCLSWHCLLLRCSVRLEVGREGSRVCMGASNSSAWVPGPAIEVASI